MDYAVIWSEEAVSDLREICFYIAQRNADAALRVGTLLNL
jgi:plasmid stabilization system protein ParE